MDTSTAAAGERAHLTCASPIRPWGVGPVAVAVNCGLAVHRCSTRSETASRCAGRRRACAPGAGRAQQRAAQFFLAGFGVKLADQRDSPPVAGAIAISRRAPDRSRSGVASTQRHLVQAFGSSSASSASCSSTIRSRLPEPIPQILRGPPTTPCARPLKLAAQGITLGVASPHANPATCSHLGSRSDARTSSKLGRGITVGRIVAGARYRPPIDRQRRICGMVLVGGSYSVDTHITVELFCSARKRALYLRRRSSYGLVVEQHRVPMAECR